MESFYGGKQGASFVIKNAFKYVDTISSDYKNAARVINEIQDTNQREAKLAELKASTMSECFKDPAYKLVWYGEYAIIDSPNKNSETNGQIYRRTLKREGNNGVEENIGWYAEYIGQVTGPAGPATQLGGITNTSALEQSFDALAEILQQEDYILYPDNANNGQLSDVYPSNYENNTNLFINPLGGKNSINFIRGDTPKLNSNLPAKYFDNEHNYIANGGYSWYYTRIRDVNGDKVNIYLGFDIPYYVIDFDNNIDTLHYTNNATIIPNILGNFYTQYHLGVPQGVSGGYYGNFRVEEYNNEKNYYEPDDINYDDTTYTYSKPLQGTVTFENKTGWIGTFYWFKRTLGENESNPQEIDNIYFGDFKTIRNITMDGTEYVQAIDDETLPEGYDPADYKIENIAEDWQNPYYVVYTRTPSEPVEIITPNHKDGTLTIHYTDNTEDSFKKQIKWIDNIELTEDIPEHAIYIEAEDANTLPEGYEDDTIYQIITVVEDGQTYYRVYTRDPEDPVMDIVPGHKDGTLSIKYNNSPIPDIWEKAIQWIDNITLDNDGTLTIDYNTGNTTVLTEAIMSISDITLNDDGTVIINYNTGDSETFDKKLRWVDWAKLPSNNDEPGFEKGHLYLKFNWRYVDAEYDENTQQYILPSGYDSNNYIVKNIASNGMEPYYVVCNNNTLQTPVKVTDKPNDFGLVGFTEKGIYIQGKNLWAETNSNNDINATMSAAVNAQGSDISTEKSYAVNIYVQAEDANTLPADYTDDTIYKIVSVTQDGQTYYHVHLINQDDPSAPGEPVVDHIAVAYYDTATTTWKSLGALDSSNLSVSIPDDQPTIVNGSLNAPWLPRVSD